MLAARAVPFPFVASALFHTTSPFWRSQLNNRPRVEPQRMWHLVDARERVVGRVATEVAQLLMGKAKPIFRRDVDVGDYVVVVNAQHSVFTGRKLQQKVYRWHTPYPGGLREIPAWIMMRDRPDEVLKRAIYGMLPKNLLRRQFMRKLRVYAGPEHPHGSQLRCRGGAFATTDAPGPVELGFVPAIRDEVVAWMEDEALKKGQRAVSVDTYRDLLHKWEEAHPGQDPAPVSPPKRKERPVVWW